MAFNYADYASNPTVYSPAAKGVLCKSFKIDIPAGSGGTSGTTYTIGYLPKGAQLVHGGIWVSTAVAGTTVTSATMALAVGGRNFFSGSNVFTAAALTAPSSVVYYQNLDTVTQADAPVTYTLTLGGGGTVANAGLIYVALLYVM